MMISGKTYRLFAVLILTCWFILGCEKKEEVLQPLDYDEYSSVVGPEGKTINFYQSLNSLIPKNLLPSLEIPAGTFTTPARITVAYQKLFEGNLPDELSNVSPDNYVWFFKAESVSQNTDLGFQQPIKLTLSFPQSSGGLLLEKYQYLFKLYQIKPGLDYADFSNWQLVENYDLDTIANKITTEIDDFEYGYCILFNEIRRQDVVIINAVGADLLSDFDDSILVTSGVNSSYFDLTTLNDIGLTYYDSVTHFSWQGSYNFLEFAFLGDSTGTYTGNSIIINFNTYLVITGEYYFQFWNTVSTILEISKYGNIGEFVEGRITGKMKEREGFEREVEVNIYFKLTRTR